MDILDPTATSIEVTLDGPNKRLRKIHVVGNIIGKNVQLIRGGGERARDLYCYQVKDFFEGAARPELDTLRDLAGDIMKMAFVRGVTVIVNNGDGYFTFGNPEGSMFPAINAAMGGNERILH